MKEVSIGEIYTCGGLHYLILEEYDAEDRKMFYCSLDSNKDENTLLEAEEIGFLTPREEWKYVGKVTESQYKIALENFHSNMKKRQISMLKFINCNSNPRFDGAMDFRAPESIMLEQLNESIESGLIPNHEQGIFIRYGYGALVGFCPENCTTIEDALRFTFADFNRKVVGRPTIKERICELINGDYLLTNPYFGYAKMVEEGYDLVLGPGCVVYGEKWSKAIYCRNYDEILENSNKKNKIYQRNNKRKIKF